MKVLEAYSNSFTSEGGVEVHLSDLCKCLKNRGHEVTVLSYAEAGPKVEIIDGINILRIRIPHILLLLRYPGIIILSLKMGYLAQKMRIDVVHAHGYTAAMAGAFVAKILHKPIVATFHLAPQYTDRPLLFLELIEKQVRAIFMSYLSLIICVSMSTLRELRRSGVVSNNITLQWNWVPLSTVSLDKNFVESEEKISPENLSKTINIISVGRLSSQKGFDLLIHAVRSLVKEGLDIDVKIIGEGSERNHLFQMCIDLGLDKNIELVGRVSDEKKILLIKSSDIFILPSRFEGLPLTILEAMYLGKPVIATDVGGIKEIITDGCDGVLIKPNVPSLILSLKSVIAHPFFRNKIAEKARKTVEARFSPDNCRKTVYLLENLAKRGS